MGSPTRILLAQVRAPGVRSSDLIPFDRLAPDAYRVAHRFYLFACSDVETIGTRRWMSAEIDHVLVGRSQITAGAVTRLCRTAFGTGLDFHLPGG